MVHTFDAKTKYRAVTRAITRIFNPDNSLLTEKDLWKTNYGIIVGMIRP